MTQIVLANQAYSGHMTDEGWQLQSGLELDGWDLVGPHFEGNYQDVRHILKDFKPHNIFVQDKRDWDYHSGCPGATKDLRFTHIGALSRYEGSVSVVVKDAGPEGSEYHAEFCGETKPDAVVIYYHPLSVLKHCPWLTGFRLVRTYHSIKADHIPPFCPANERKPLCGSGAVFDGVYPLRARVRAKAESFGMEWLRHPGYNNFTGPITPFYLRFLNRFKVSFCSASTYGFSLRKIIESVACGCTVVTDLPQYDVLPEIDRALVRVKPGISDQDLKVVFEQAIADWGEDGRRKWAEKAVRYYNYVAIGRRLSQALLRV